MVNYQLQFSSRHNVNPKHDELRIDGLPLGKSKIMSSKNKKLFGVWMDSHHATIVGKQGFNSGDFFILGHVENPGESNNSNENMANNQKIALTNKYFKEIASIMPNIDEIHVTGTGQIQEQFIKFLRDAPQYRNTKSTESTSNKMSDAHLADFIMKHFN
jgi:stalled ribosome rescue protein Dom34